MTDNWFSNKAQIIQTIAGVFSATGAIISMVNITVGFANIPPWVLPGSIGTLVGLIIAIGSRFLFYPRPNDSQSTAEPLEAKPLTATLLKREFVRTDNSGVTYKNKLYLTFSNKSGDALIVGPKLEWTRNQLQNVSMGNRHVWQVEDVDGKWSEEQPMVRVPGGQQFKTWLGLSNTVDERSIKALYGSAGTLAVSIVTEGLFEFKI